MTGVAERVKGFLESMIWEKIKEMGPIEEISHDERGSQIWINEKRIQDLGIYDRCHICHCELKDGNFIVFDGLFFCLDCRPKP
jgi:hypothetical protein